MSNVHSLGRTRSSWIDIAKGLGILLVVYGHVARGLFNAHVPMDTWWFRTVDQAIYAFHMPLFFLLSGYFLMPSLLRKGPAAFMEGRVATVLYPYVLWSLLQGGVEVVMSRWTSTHVTWAEVLSLAWAPRAQFWFLYALFLMSVIAVLVCWRRPRTGPLALIGLGIAGYALYSGSWPVAITLECAELVYFATGVWLGSLWSRKAPSADKAALHSLIAAFVLGLAAVAARDWSAAPPRLVSLLMALFACAVVFRLAMALARVPRLNDLLSALGQASMAIFLAHVLVASGIRIALSKLLHVQDVSLHLWIGMTAGVGLPWWLWRQSSAWRLSWLFEAPASMRRRWGHADPAPASASS